MNITFCDGMLMQVVLQDDKAIVLSKQEIGTEAVNFYNYFAKYRLSPEEPVLKLSNCSDSKAVEIISGQPIVNQFYLNSISNYQNRQAAAKEALTNTRNLVQQAFSDLDDAFSERHGTSITSAYREPNGGQGAFMPKQVTTTFALLNNRIVQVYTVKDLYEYLALDFCHANYPSEPVKQIAICPCCKKAFRKSQRNKVYCSKACKDQSIKENNRKASPYYAKYRYLQQYNNRRLNKWRRQMAGLPTQVQKLQDAYDTWNEWARVEFEQATKTYSFMEQGKQEGVEEFGERLKGKWKSLTGDLTTRATGL